MFLELDAGYKCLLCKKSCIFTLRICAIMICIPKLVWVILQQKECLKKKTYHFTLVPISEVT